MLKNYLKIALRSLSKNKLYAIVNVGGLTLGIAGCLFIGLYIWSELSFDRFQQKGDRTVRMVMDYTISGGESHIAVCGTKAGPQMKRIFPAVESFVRIDKLAQTVITGTQAYEEKQFLFADSNFFSVFSFPLIEGDPRTVLDGPKKIVLTASMAKKYFGAEDPVGKTVKLNGNADYVVSGVAADAPLNSQIRFDFVTGFSNLNAAKRPETWWNANYATYLVLQKPSQIAGLQKEIHTYMAQVAKQELDVKGNDYFTYQLEPLYQVHLHSTAGDGLVPPGSLTDIYVLATIAILILLIACVNYTNLATAQAASRGTEIAVRKVLGARMDQLFSQFMGESTLLTIISLILALAICLVSLPLFNAITGKAFTIGMLLQPIPMLGLLLLGVLISFLAGSYPAFILSNAAVAGMLKSGIRIASSGDGMRKSLIVFQFVISVFLVISTIIVLRQLSFIRNRDLGFDKDHVLVLPVDGKIRAQEWALKDAFKLDPHVLGVAGTYQAPTSVGWGDELSGDNGHGTMRFNTNAMPVDEDFIGTMKMTLLAGSNFNRNMYALQDTSNNGENFRNSFIVNEQVVKSFGWTPEQAIGKTISKGAPGLIVGVVKDFHYTSLHQPIGRMVLFLDTSNNSELLVRISGENMTATLAYLSKVWKERVTHRPFQYSFMDEDYNDMYATEQKAAKVFELFSGLAILLACMGLFAMAAYATVKRQKEIGIRKVLGASLKDITLLVSGNFLKLVLIGFFIATPLAWLAAHRWLGDFAYRISIEWWVFVVSGVLSVLIAALTVGYHAIRVGSANPIDSLRAE